MHEDHTVHALRLDGVGRRYGMHGPWALRGVTLQAPVGSLVRVEGTNGSGKSTLLRIVAGVDRPTTGVVTGRPAASTAYVPERFPPALPFPVLRYLTHLGAVRGLSAATARARAMQWLERFGIAGHARTPLDALSKGTCQKVAATQALLADPRLLVLDEAWTGLDSDARAVLDDAVRERVAAGAVVFFVDHDPRRLADEATAVYGVDTGRWVTGSRARVEGSGGPSDPQPASLPSLPLPSGPSPSPPASSPSPSSGPAAGPVVIEAVGGEGLPESAGEFTATPEGGVRIEVPAGESDAVLRALLAARPPWHITAVGSRPPRPAAAPPRPVQGAAPAGSGRLPAGRRPPAGALLRYQADLLIRSHRWLPPFLFYGAVMAIGVAGGQPLLGSLGYAAALLLPVAAWAVRVCVTNEPGAARACVASAVGAARAQRGALLAALTASAVLGLAGTAVVAAVSGAHADDPRTAVPVGPAVVAGSMAAAVCVLLGTAVGALTNPPLVRGSGWSVLVTALAAGAVLIVSGSPAQAAVTDLVKGSHTGTVHYPVPALLLAAAIAALAVWVSGRALSRLGTPRA